MRVFCTWETQTELTIKCSRSVKLEMNPHILVCNLNPAASAIDVFTPKT